MTTPIDPHQFFKEATLRVCGSLEVEKALWDCLRYLREFIPAVRMTFHVYNEAHGEVETVAFANPRSSVALTKKTRLGHEGRRMAGRYLKSPRLHLIQHIREGKVTAPVAKDLGLPDCAGIVMQLEMEDRTLGAVAITGESGVVFDRGHAQLIEMLKQPFAIAMANILRYREVLALKEQLVQENAQLLDELKQHGHQEIVGASQQLKDVMRMVHQVAPTGSPVLLLGETGVGKELFANAIHRMSPRSQGPLIKVNCGAIPPSLIDSELFGHEKGAFTGATAVKRGRFERADGGTLFLDEIGELPLDAQVRLLRALQEKEIERVGGSTPIPLDIRIVAATHRDLERLLAAGKFREDLFYRLNVFPVHIPPLRERASDIPILVHYFLQVKSREMGISSCPPLAHGAMERLTRHPWPGNVRELENAVERALILCGQAPLAFHEISANTCAPDSTDLAPVPDPTLNLDAVVARTIRQALRQANGRVEGAGGAADLLGLNPGTLRHRMRKLGIAFGRNAVSQYR